MRSRDNKKEAGSNLAEWKPKTTLGKKVKNGEITNIDQILSKGLKILEPEIVDILLPDLETEFLMIGQSRGKFGGGKRSIWRNTQKISKEGSKMSFATMAVVGNHNGYIGLGFGKGKETMPAREKAIRQAKINLIKIRRGDGSWAPGGDPYHSIPYTVEGKSGSLKIRLMPAPQGSSLVVPSECQKILKLAGIKNAYSKTFGQTGTRVNLVKACFEALKKLSQVKVRYADKQKIAEEKQ